MNVKTFGKRAWIRYNLTACIAVRLLNQERVHVADPATVGAAPSGGFSGIGAAGGFSTWDDFSALPQVWESQLCVRAQATSWPWASVLVEHDSRRGEPRPEPAAGAGVGQSAPRGGELSALHNSVPSAGGGQRTDLSAASG